MVSLQAPRAQGRSAPITTATMNKKVTPGITDHSGANQHSIFSILTHSNLIFFLCHPFPSEPEVVDEVEDITVRVLSPQSVLITWVDPLVEKKKEIPGGSR